MFYYRKAEGSSIADMRCFNWDKASAKINFDEMHIVKGDNYYYLYIHAQSFTDSCASRDDKWVFPEDTNVRVAISRKDYQEIDYKTKQEKTVYQSRLEKALCVCIEKYIPSGFAFAGTLNLQDSTILERLLPDKDGNSVTLSSEISGFILDSLYNLKPLPPDTFVHFKKEDLIPPNAKKSGSGSYAPKSQTFYEKANDKFQWIKEQLTSKYPALKIDNIYDLSEHGLCEQPVPDDIKAKANDIYRACLEFLSHV